MALEYSLLLLKAVSALGAVYLIPKLLSSILWRPPAPLPPGPRLLPFIGNMLDLPKKHAHIHWAKYKELYGPISSITVLGQTVVIINDAQKVFDILERDTSKYSNRPTFTFGGEICGNDATFALLQPGQRLRAMRKQFHQFMGTRQAVTRLEPVEELETRRFLYRTMQGPSNFRKHLRTLAGAIILDATYGYKIKPHDPDPLLDAVRETTDNFLASIDFGTWVVDSFRFLKYFPGWLPGMGFKRLAKEWRSLNMKVVDAPYKFTEGQLKSNSLTQENFTSINLSQGPLSDEDMDILKWSANAMYVGGAETAVSAFATFFLAMLLHPEVLIKAQAEIDLVVGPNRLPTFTDRPKLLYIDAIAKETLRWNPITPLAPPHSPAEDDIFEGYFIPKGAIIVPNVWKITRDPENYHEATVFKPERFLGSQPELDPRRLAFGFGRRICPGLELAEASIFITIAMSVAVFDIRKAKDIHGKDIEPFYEYTDKFISHPKDFVCSITPRSQKASELIVSVVDEHPFEAGDADKLDLNI